MPAATPLMPIAFLILSDDTESLFSRIVPLVLYHRGSDRMYADKRSEMEHRKDVDDNYRNQRGTAKYRPKARAALNTEALTIQKA
jgi:hypothetical protein